MKKEKIRVMSNSGDESIFYKVKRGSRVMIGTGEHATFVRVGSRGSYNERENTILKRWEREEKINKIFDMVSNLTTKVVLYKIKKIMLEEMKKDYYQNITNIKEVIDIDTHLMEKFNLGIDYMHVENLVIWQNGFYNFNKFNFPILSSLKSKTLDYEKCDLIIPKKLIYTKFNVKED